jgi:hypothetical protein
VGGHARDGTRALSAVAGLCVVAQVGRWVVIFGQMVCGHISTILCWCTDGALSCDFWPDVDGVSSRNCSFVAQVGRIILISGQMLRVFVLVSQVFVVA